MTMKRKSFSIVLVLILLASQVSFLSSCNSVSKKQKFLEYYFNYFDTVTTITGYTETEEEFKIICEEIKTELNEYHNLYNTMLPICELIYNTNVIHSIIS